jgi:CRP-like cAMP-binding protein
MSLQSLRARNALLAVLTDDEALLFEKISAPVAFFPNAVIFEEDAPADHFFIVEQGRVGLEMTAPGRAPFVLQTLGPGELVGVSWLFPPFRWGWRARALAATETLRFDARWVRDRCQADRDLGFRVAAVLAEEAVRRLHGARLQLLDLYQAAGR